VCVCVVLLAPPQDYEEALKDLTACAALDAEDGAVKKALERVKQRISQQKEDQKKKFSKMFQ
jgi:hypothetical protein